MSGERSGQVEDLSAMADACRNDENLRAQLEVSATDSVATAEMTRIVGPVSTPSKPGVRLGPYQLEVLLGEGGMGQVFRARDTRLGRPVAIKLIRAEQAQRPDFRVRFQREARAT